jgi:DNA recombination protein RmuC
VDAVLLLVGVAVGLLAGFALALFALLSGSGRFGRLMERTTKAQLSDAQASLVSLAREELSAQAGGLRNELEARERLLTDQIQRLNDTVQQLSRERQVEQGRLMHELSQLSTVTSGLRETIGSSTSRGSWGEFQLRRIVELAGLVPWCDFEEQPSLAGPDGSVRPDMVVHLPGGRNVVVDAKAPLEAFRSRSEASGAAARPDLAKAAESLRRHINELGRRRYWSAVSDSIDFVVLFVPLESMLGSALGADSEILEYAIERQVVLATPATLLALLRGIALSWQQQTLIENSRQIASQAGQLHSRLTTMVAHLGKLRAGLTTAVGAFNDAVGSFEARVMPAAARMRELGLPVEVMEAVPEIEADLRPLRMAEFSTPDDPEPPSVRQD